MAEMIFSEDMEIFAISPFWTPLDGVNVENNILAMFEDNWFPNITQIFVDPISMAPTMFLDLLISNVFSYF